MNKFWKVIALLFLTVSLLPLKWVGAAPSHLFRAPTATSTPIRASTPEVDGTVYHIVQQDEALWSIALAYDTTVEQLKLLNHLSSNEIFIGQKILIVKPEIKTETPSPTVTVTLGIPTSTATHPVTPTATSTSTPLPVPPASRQTSGFVLGVIVLTALLAAGIGAWLGSKKKTSTLD